MTKVRVSVENNSAAGGLYLTPAWIGFHNGSFDLYNIGSVASPGLESLAEDGNIGLIGTQLLDTDSDAQQLIVTGELGPIAPGEFAAGIVDIDAISNGFITIGAMILPSNDAFIGTDDAIQLFNGNGQFTGPVSIEFDGTDILDAGTEVNTETGAAFINQNPTDMGIDDNDSVSQHPGFNGSFGNPVGEGNQIILGGVNDFGEPILPEAADFTRANFNVATVHIGLVNEFNGGDGRDNFRGGSEDDIVELGGGDDRADGGDGNDILRGGAGDDVLRGGKGSDILEGGDDNDNLRGNDGNDIIDTGNGDNRASGGKGADILIGGHGADIFDGGAGNDQITTGNGDNVVRGGKGADVLIGGHGADIFEGGAGDDRITTGNGDNEARGGKGADVLIGGHGADIFRGGSGADQFIKNGDGADVVLDFKASQQDLLGIDLDGIDTFEELMAVGFQDGRSTVFNFSDASSLELVNTDINSLTVDDVFFL